MISLYAELTAQKELADAIGRTVQELDTWPNETVQTLRLIHQTVKGYAREQARKANGRNDGP